MSVETKAQEYYSHSPFNELVFLQSILPPLPFDPRKQTLTPELEYLRQRCLSQEMLTPDMQLTPGLLMQEAPKSLHSSALLATYGIGLLDIKTKKRVAHCGFVVIDDVMFISNTPQGLGRPDIWGGLLKDTLTSRERNSLLRSDFRPRMFSHMFVLAADLNLRYVYGTAAKNHYKVKNNYITLTRGEKLMDRWYQYFGFYQRNNGDFVLPIGHSPLPADYE